MASDVDLTGLWVPLVTPFGEDGEVDPGAIKGLCADLIQGGAHGIVALGTTGETPVLDDQERAVVIEACSSICLERGVPLMVGTGSNNTRTTLEATAALAGAEAAMAALVVVPYYTRPSEAAVVAHMRTVATASPVPLVVYNVPYRTGRGLGAPALLELANTPNVVGVKQAVGGLDRDTLELLRQCPDGFEVLSGDDLFIVPTLAMGGRGAIAASAHFCTPLFAEMIEAGLDSRVEEARALATRLHPVIENGFAEPNPAVWKAALHATGRIASPDVRSPLANASKEAVDRLLGAVDEAMNPVRR